MRILHAPIDVAGQTGLQAQGLRACGVDATAWFEPHPFGYDVEPDVPPWARSRRPNQMWQAAQVPTVWWRFDVVHFHAGRSLLPSRLKYPDARAFSRRIRVLQQFVGSDARLPSVEASRNKWYVNTHGEDERANRERLARWADLAHGQVAFQDHSLDYAFSEYFDRVHIVPLCVDTQRIRPQPWPERRSPVVVHAPSQRGFKGSDSVVAAIEKLRARGRSVDYREVHGVGHKDVIAAMGSADLVIDQLRVGAFGTASVEAMALGRPVICFLLPDLVSTLGADQPFIVADPSTLADVMDEWLFDAAALRKRGKQSRQYAEAVHDIRVVGEHLLGVYQQLSEP